FLLMLFGAFRQSDDFMAACRPASLAFRKSEVSVCSWTSGKSLMHSSRFFEGEVGGFPSSGRVTGYSVERLGYLRESLSISLAEILQ
ncbi:MAG: hypothetical protein WBE38_07730, partial [Terracidiphilus sp.]